MLRLYRIDARRHAALRRRTRRRGGGCVDGDIFGEFREGVRRVAPEGARVLAPVLPSKIVCVGLNYKDHAAEQNKPLPAEPLIFIKPSTAVIGPGEPIRIRRAWAASITRPSSASSSAAARQRVRGRGRRERTSSASSASTTSRRGSCRRRTASTRAQGLRHVRAHRPVHRGRPRRPRACRCEATSTAPCGRIRSTRELIFTIPELVAFISAVMTLLPGDIISTGTPAGIGPMQAGDPVDDSRRRRGRADQPVWRRGLCSRPRDDASGDRIMKLFIDTGTSRTIERSCRSASSTASRPIRRCWRRKAATRARSSRRSADSCRGRSAPRSSPPTPQGMIARAASWRPSTSTSSSRCRSRAKASRRARRSPAKASA